MLSVWSKGLKQGRILTNVDSLTRQTFLSGSESALPHAFNLHQEASLVTSSLRSNLSARQAPDKKTRWLCLGRKGSFGSSLCLRNQQEPTGTNGNQREPTPSEANKETHCTLSSGGVLDAHVSNQSTCARKNKKKLRLCQAHNQGVQPIQKKSRSSPLELRVPTRLCALVMVSSQAPENQNAGLKPSTSKSKGGPERRCLLGLPGRSRQKGSED